MVYKIDCGHAVALRLVRQKEKGSNLTFCFQEESYEVEVPARLEGVAARSETTVQSVESWW